jgi:hypothetical protein
LLYGNFSVFIYSVYFYSVARAGLEVLTGVIFYFAGMLVTAATTGLTGVGTFGIFISKSNLLVLGSTSHFYF